MNESNFNTSKIRVTRAGLKSQEGVVLIIALLFLILLTVIAISSSNLATVEERMARNSRDYNVAFQAAEAALRDAESDIRSDGLAPVTPQRISGSTGFTAACTNGLCGTSTGAELSPRPWENTGNYLADAVRSVGYGEQTGANPLAASNQSTETPTRTPPKVKVGGVSRQPRYLIEALIDKTPGLSTQGAGYGKNPNKYVYRTTAIGFGTQAGTQSIVQGMYKLQ
jgi:type IV pilus assembly protein PilX